MWYISLSLHYDVQVTIGLNLNYQLEDRLTVVDPNRDDVSSRTIIAIVIIAVFLVGGITAVIVFFAIQGKTKSRKIQQGY